MKEFRKINEAEVNTEDAKKIKDILSGGYEDFVSKLKENAKDPKVIAILNLGKDDGIPTDEEIQVQDNVSYSCDTLIPTQSQIGLADSLGWLAKNNPEGAKKLIEGDTSTFNDNRILTANGKYILDGHHRWSQVYLFNPNAKIPAVNLVIPGLDEKQILKVIQMAIVATYKDLYMKDANAETDIFSDEKMPKDVIIKKLPEIMGEKMIEVCKKAWNLDSNEKIISKITENALKLKAKKPNDAPQRKFMPQPSDTAEKLAGKPEEQTKDYKGIPSDFINKIKSGELNFKAPLAKESRIIKTYEKFIQNFNK